MARTQWDRAAAVVAFLLGALALLLGYLGVSGTPHVAAQLPYFISGGLAGIFLLAIASVAWISADLRDEWRELRALRLRLDDLQVTNARADVADPTAVSDARPKDAAPKRRARTPRPDKARNEEG